MWLETKLHLICQLISQNKIAQILKNNTLFFLFFTLASKVFSYVLSVFFFLIDLEQECSANL